MQAEAGFIPQVLYKYGMLKNQQPTHKNMLETMKPKTQWLQSKMMDWEKIFKNLWKKSPSGQSFLAFGNKQKRIDFEFSQKTLF